jgi:hypothetical protein
LECNRVSYCSQECKLADVDHAYICYRDLCDYIKFIIEFHKAGNCHHYACEELNIRLDRFTPDHYQKSNRIALHFGNHLIKNLTPPHKPIVTLALAPWLCVICGRHIDTYNYPPLEWISIDGYNANYLRCGECLSNNYYLCPSRFVSSLTCATDVKKIVIFSIMVLKHTHLYQLNDINPLIIRILFKLLKCCNEPKSGIGLFDMMINKTNC